MGDMTQPSDPFFEPYDRRQIAYGNVASVALQAYLDQVDRRGCALDLGAGAGRDTIAIAAAGYQVTAIDRSRRGCQRIAERAMKSGVKPRVQTVTADVRDFPIQPKSFDLVVATTVLDHLPPGDARDLWERMSAALTDTGAIYVEVHTTEDPGSGQLPGSASPAPVSETATEVINYFTPNQLLQWAGEPASRLRVLRYEERLEWDYTHGPEHLHGKAVLLAVRQGHHPAWFGQPAVFPKREHAEQEPKR